MQNTDEFRKRAKKLVDQAKKMQKAAGVLAELTTTFVDDAMQLSMLDAVYKPGNDPFAKGMAELVGVLNTLSTLQSTWSTSIGNKLIDPLDDLVKKGFKRYDDSKKSYRKAISKHESAFGKMLSVKEGATAEDKLDMQKSVDAAVVALQDGTLEHLEAINEVDAKKLLVMLRQMHAFMEETRSLYVSGAESVTELSPALKGMQATMVERRRVLNSIDRDMFLAVKADINAAKREQAMVTHELEKELRALQPMTELEREELNIQPGPLSPFAREKSGWIHKKAGKRMISKWDRRFAVLKDGVFRLYRSLQADVNEPSTELNVMVANVKPLTDQSSSRPNVFQMVGIERTYLLQAEDEEQMNEWLNVIQNATAYALASAESAASSSAKANAVHPLKENLLGVDELEQSLFSLWDTPGNEICCDCFAQRPQWVSINLGCLICIECSGHHRNLGVHISKVRSFRLDDWDATVMDYLQGMGNIKVNSIYEANQGRVVRYRPKDETNALMRESYIKKKYTQKFMVEAPEYAQDPDAASLCLFNAAVRGDAVGILEALACGGSIDWVSDESSSYTPLLAAVSHGAKTATTALVLNSANVNAVDIYGKTALHIAASTGAVDLARLLLNNDASMETEDLQGMTPLDYANLAGATETADLLTRLDAPFQYEFIQGGSGQGYDQPYRPQILARADDPLPPPPPGGLRNSPPPSPKRPSPISTSGRSSRSSSDAPPLPVPPAKGKRPRPRSVALQSNVDVVTSDDGSASTVKMRRQLPVLPPPSLKPKPKPRPTGAKTKPPAPSGPPPPVDDDEDDDDDNE